MSAQTGLAAINADVLSAVNDMIGRVVLFNTTDDKRWSGVLNAIGPEFQFGFDLVVEITEENQNHLFRRQKDITDKMIFSFEDIVDFAYVTEEDKKNQFVSKFATDRQYHGNDANGDDDLEEWNGGDEEENVGGAIEDDNANAGSQNSRRSNHNNGGQAGWSAADMFAANEKQVKSTFKEDLTQYTTVDVVGTDEDRARAERLAREIESNSSSRFMANLENDDDERDLDKATRQDDFDNGNNQRGKRGNTYNQPPPQRRNPNITPNGQPPNRRAEGLRGDRRNSGGSSANNRSYGAPASSQNYQQQQPQGQKGGSHGNRRQAEEYREMDWQMAKGKGQNQGQDHSFRQQQKQMLDPRPSAKQPEGDKGTGSGSRVTEMKKWGNDFSLGTPPKEQSPAPGSAPPAPQGAWNRGPPSSLVTKGTTSESTPPAADKESEHSKTATPRKEESPSTSGEGQTEVDGRQDESDNVSVTARSETDSVVTTKSQSFKFNINAPEFKPRVAPTTPTPTTPTGPPPQNLAQIPAQQQFVPQEFQQHPGMIPHAAPLMGMPPHMPPGGVPQTQGQPMLMWQGQQGYQQNQQYPMPPVSAPGVPGQMYGPAATAPITANQQAVQNSQMTSNTSGASQGDGRQGMQQMRRDGEFREPQPLYYPTYNQQGQMVPVPPQFYNQQFQGAIPQQQYPMKMMQQQGHQGNYQPRYQQAPQQVYMVPQGQPPQQHRYQGGPPQQQPFQQFQGGEQGAQQSHPNSQPTTPGPRGGEMNGQKGQQQQGTPQPQGNSNGMHREPEAGSNASLSGSASSQSGQRSGSPHAAVPPQQQQQPPSQPQHQQGPPHGGPQHGGPQHGGPQHGGPQHPIPPHVGQVQGSLVGVPPHTMPYMVMPQHPQMQPQMQQYYQQQPMYYQQMVPLQQLPMQANQHGQQSLMGERADNGYSQNSYFDYRNMPNYQQNQQQHPMHGNHMPRQNSIPQQQFGGNQGVNPSSQQAPPPAAQQQQPTSQQGGPPPPAREQQQQQQTQSPQ